MSNYSLLSLNGGKSGNSSKPVRRSPVGRRLKTFWRKCMKLSRLSKMSVMMCGSLLLTSCETLRMVTGATDSFCHIYRPVELSRKDTDDTIRQVLEYNAVWDIQCGGVNGS